MTINSIRPDALKILDAVDNFTQNKVTEATKDIIDRFYETMCKYMQINPELKCTFIGADGIEALTECIDLMAKKYGVECKNVEEKE